MAQLTGRRASENLIGLVCGLPGDRRRLRQLLALKAYIDGSGSRGQPVLVLAGYVATVEQWVPFTDEWDALLKQAGMRRFKMSEMMGRQEFAAAFYRIIEKHVSAAIACAVPCEPLAEAVREVGLDRVDDRLLNPYYFAVKAIINMTAQHQPKMGFNEPIDFIFDDQSDKKPVRDAWDAYLESPITPEVRALTGADPQFLDDERYPPLQAADLYAYWVREEWERHGTIMREPIPVPWTAKRDIPRLVVEFDKPGLLQEMAKVMDLINEARRPRMQITVTFGDLKDAER